MAKTKWSNRQRKNGDQFPINQRIEMEADINFAKETDAESAECAMGDATLHRNSISPYSLTSPDLIRYQHPLKNG